MALSPKQWLSDVGSNAAQWADLSGNGNHLDQGTGSLQPGIFSGVLNGRQVRRFDGVDDYLFRSAAFLQSLASMTIVTVFKNSGTSGGSLGVVCSAGAVSAFANDILMATTGITNDNLLFQSNNGVDGGPNLAMAINQWTILSCVFNQPARNPLAIYNASLGTTVSAASPAPATTSAALGNFEVGRYSAAPANFLNGDIAELLVFDYALSDEQRESIERGLALKYNLPTIPYV